jgi:ATP-dependent Clp protease ATP-binding subunit ClpA
MVDLTSRIDVNMSNDSDGVIWTPRLNETINRAADLARGMGRDFIGVEHIFLAILHDPTSIPSQVLGQCADINQIERRLYEVITSELYNSSSVEIADTGHDQGTDN